MPRQPILGLDGKSQVPNLSSLRVALRLALALPFVLQVGSAANVQSSQARSQAPGAIAKKAFPSVVLLLMDDSAGQPISLGSGFFVRPDTIATNMHVIKGASSGRAKIVGSQAKYEIAGIVGLDGVHDLALLRVSGVSAPFLQVATAKDQAVGDEVFAIGSPYGLEGTLSQGIISGIRNVGDDRLLQITAPISPGSSGGPVLNVAGEVVGLATASLVRGQNLNFAIPASYLSALLRVASPGPVRPLSSNKASDGPAWRELDTGIKQAVIATHVEWQDCCTVGFSLQNQLDTPIRNLYCLVIFRDSSGEPIDAVEWHRNEIILPGLAKRFDADVKESVHRLEPKIEIRVLDFRPAR